MAGKAVTQVVQSYPRQIGFGPYFRPKSVHFGDRTPGLLVPEHAVRTAAPFNNYLGRVTKPRIIEAVREAKGDATAALIEHLKKGDMAREAERLLSGAGWLPEPLRLPVIEADEAEIADLPDFLADDAEQADADDAFAIAAE